MRTAAHRLGRIFQHSLRSLTPLEPERHLISGRCINGMSLSLFDSSAVSARIILLWWVYFDGLTCYLRLGDGKCIIELSQTTPGIEVHEEALSTEIGDVTWEVLNECTFKERGSGGEATGLGKLTASALLPLQLQCFIQRT